MKTRPDRKTAAAAAVLLAVIAAAPAPADAQQENEGELIDRVIAVVEDKALMQSELELEYRRYLFQNQLESLPPEQEAELKKEFFEGLVADLLMAVHAEKTGVEVSEEVIDEEVDRAIEDSRRAAGGDVAFERELENAGLTVRQLRAQWRDKIRARRLIENLMYREVMQEVEVTEGEIRAYYRENLDDLPERPASVSLAQILIMPETSPDVENEALRRIREIRERIEGGMEFAEAAREYSEDPSADYGGSLGYLELDDLGSEPFEKAARKLIVGEVSEPVLTRFGWHLIRLDDVSGNEVKLSHILIKAEGGEADLEAAEEKARSIRGEILAGADFAEMARRYSDDETTREAGGLIGERAVKDLPEFFMEKIGGVEPGGIAPLVEDSKGFRIVKVIDRSEPRKYTYKEAREELERLLKQQKLQQEFKEYVAELEKIYYVDYKI